MPLPRYILAIVPAVVLAAVAWAQPSLAADPVARTPDAINKRLKEVQRSIDAGKTKSQSLEQAAERLNEALSRTRRDRIAAAKAILEFEDRASGLEEEIAALSAIAKEKATLLATRRVQFADILAGLQRLSQVPPEAVIARPERPTDLVRSAILLRSAVPRIEAQANQLREDLIALAEARSGLAKRRKSLAETRASLEKEQGRLDQILVRTRNEHHAAIQAQRDEDKQLQALAREAQNLRQLFGGLLRPGGAKPTKNSINSKPKRNARNTTTRSRAGSKTQPSIALARGKLPLPVAGRITRRYGQAAANGITQKGVTISTRQGARVVALHDGTIVFAGPFRGYGQLLIISHGGGYHSLLAGFDRIDGILGQTLKAGEPVGIMGQSKGVRPSLYLELRRKGQPINPMPWLKTSKGKASG